MPFQLRAPTRERFAYNNAGFVLLAILAERAASTAFVDLVQQRVCKPVNMVDTADLRSDTAEGSRYGLGFWRHASGPGVMLEGYDAGVSFRTVHLPHRARSRFRHNPHGHRSDGAWPITRALDQMLLGW